MRRETFVRGNSATAALPGDGRSEHNGPWARKGPLGALPALSTSARRALVCTALLAVLDAAALVTQAFVLASVLAALVAGDTAGHGPALVLLLAAVLTRAVLAWGKRVVAARAAAGAKEELRAKVVDHALRLGPEWIDHRGAGRLTTLTTKGLDALDAYFTDYLPALVTAAVVPATAGVAVLAADWPSAVLIAGTVPLLPMFAILIGKYTADRVGTAADAVHRLSGHLLELVRALPVLTAFRRAQAQAEVVRGVSDRHRRTTLSTLRVAFSSAFALELAATLSVALVAVLIGVRLVSGDLSLAVGLGVLILAPECYQPLRSVGTAFHASADGVEAVRRVADVLAEPEPRHGTRTPGRGEIRIRGLRVRRRAGFAPDALELTLRPGGTAWLNSRSGTGKTTTLSVLLGFVPPESGSVTVDGVELGELDMPVWRESLAWVPQSPAFAGGTVRDELELAVPDGPMGDDAAASGAAVGGAGNGTGYPGGSGAEHGTESDVENNTGNGAACETAGGRVDTADADIEAVLARLGLGGLGARPVARLSAGQRQRLAVARALLRVRRGAWVLLLDEPTAYLDTANADRVWAAVREAERSGAAVLIAAHERGGHAGDGHRGTGTRNDHHDPGPPGGHPDVRVLDDEGGVDTEDDGHGAETGNGRRDVAVPDHRRGADGVDDQRGARVPSEQRSADAEEDHLGAGVPTGPVDDPARDGAVTPGRGAGDPADPAGPPHVPPLSLRWLVDSRMVRGVLLGALALLCGVALTATSGWLIARASQQPPILTLTVAVVGVRTFGLARAALRYLERLVIHDAAFRVATRLRERLWCALVRLGPARTARLRRGEGARRLVDDVDTVRDLLPRAVTPPLVVGAVALGACALQAAVLPSAGGVLLAAVVVGGVLAPALALAAERRATGALADGRRDVANQVLGLFDAAAELIAVGAHRRRRARLARTDARLAALARRQAFGAGAAEAVITASTGIAAVVCTGLGVRAVAEGVLDPVLAPVLALVPLALAEALTALPPCAQHRDALRAARRRLAAVLGAQEPTSAEQGRIAVRAGGYVALRGVHVRWPPDPWGAPAADGTPVRPQARALRGVDLEVEPGSRIAVVGPSGAGKSTLLATMLGFLRPEQGSAVLPERVAWAPQEPQLVSTTIAENLRLADPHAGAAQLRRALRTAGLGGTDPHTMLGDAGAGLSGGQAQRVAVARALLAAPEADVVLLDEPTAHLDEHTAQAMLARIRTVLAGKTLVHVTHRPEEARDADVVVEVSGGTVRVRRRDDADPAVAGRKS